VAKAAIEFAGVHKNYLSHGETVQAVKPTDLVIAQGEFFSLLGPSGCGKTTTMRMIAGFEEPTAGTVLLDGKDVTHVPAHKRDVNMVFQSYALFPHMNVLENVAYGPTVSGDRGAKDKAMEKLRMVGLVAFAHRMPSELSGGQQQRVAVARALVNRPKLVLADEPTGNLDRKHAHESLLLIGEVCREHEAALLLVSHSEETLAHFEQRRDFAEFNRPQALAK